MAGTLKVGGKVLATHNSETDEITLSDAYVGETFSGIMEVDQWYLSADEDGSSSPFDNWARNNFTGFSKIGTGLSHSSGVFTFPRQGVYELNCMFNTYEDTGGNDPAGIILEVSVDGGVSYNVVAESQTYFIDPNRQGCIVILYIFNVNIDNFLFRFVHNSWASGNIARGATDRIRSGFTIKRLGPAQ